MGKIKHKPETMQAAADIGAITGSTKAAASMVGVPPTTAQDWINMDRDGTLQEHMEKIGSKSIDNDKGNVVQQNADLIKEWRIQKRLEYTNAAMDVCLQLIRRMGELVNDTKSIKDIAVALGVATEKLLLVSGEATSRSESVHSVNREELLNAAQSVSEKVKTLPRKKAV
jgi:hypothetical protein